MKIECPFCADPPDKRGDMITATCAPCNQRWAQGATLDEFRARNSFLTRYHREESEHLIGVLRQAYRQNRRTEKPPINPSESASSSTQGIRK